MKMNTRNSQRTTRRSGLTVLETALVLNVFLLILFGIFEFGRALMVRNLVNHAARGAARLAASGNDDLTTADIRAKATQLLAGQTFGQVPIIQVYKADANGSNIGLWGDAGFGEGIAVQVELDFRTSLPALGILPNTVRFTGKSVMRSEGD